ncbi:YcxB family protein [Roseimicrobium sp. ORNL1]|uniref:YcxB family protein n=1 Tax=Roseimicrobium sp. ORNL1 TaxID=2711231 RepID=UPI0013E112E7|nr:YcxB family protein [Roseimicrobium sp. ORNL1]QIF02814.1 YcxB family protein [Roseimicrobium sp. ORNL1]
MITEDAANAGNERPSTTSEGPEISAHYTWTAEELLAARRLHGLHTLRRPFRFGFGLIVLLALLGACMAIYHDGPSFTAVLLLLASLYMAFFRRHYLRWNTKRQFRKRPDNGSQVNWTFTSERAQVTLSDGSKAENPWSTFVKAVLAPEGVLLYPINELFYWVPRGGFESEEVFQEFVSMVQKKVSKTHSVGARKS